MDDEAIDVAEKEYGRNEMIMVKITIILMQL